MVFETVGSQRRQKASAEMLGRTGQRSDRRRLKLWGEHTAKAVVESREMPKVVLLTWRISTWSCRCYLSSACGQGQEVRDRQGMTVDRSACADPSVAASHKSLFDVGAAVVAAAVEHLAEVAIPAVASCDSRGAPVATMMYWCDESAHEWEEDAAVAAVAGNADSILEDTAVALKGSRGFRRICADRYREGWAAAADAPWQGDRETGLGSTVAARHSVGKAIDYKATQRCARRAAGMAVGDP